jgi:uncharacterized protein (DUF433 family)
MSDETTQKTTSEGSLATVGLPDDGGRLPLRLHPGGVVRVGETRVPLDLVVENYENGMTPEEMVRAYDSLVVADVYAVIGYYLRHRETVRKYLSRREEEARELRSQLESSPLTVSANKLRARQAALETADVASGE